MRRICRIKNCDSHVHGHGLCKKHYNRKRAHGDPHKVLVAPKGSGTLSQPGARGTHYRLYLVNGRRVTEHVLIAEKVLGRRLKFPEQIHHVDENGLNNKNKNLVICPDTAYHQLLHRRQEALSQCGDANFRRCRLCHEWDNPDNLYVGKKDVFHLSCKRKEYAETRKR